MSLPEKIMLSGGRDFFNQISLSVYIYVASVIIYLASFILFLKKKAGLALQIAALVFLVFFALPFKFSRLLAPVSLVSLPIFFILAKNLLISPRLKVFLAQTTLALIVLIITASIFTGHVVGSREDISVVTINNNQKAIANLFWKPFFPTSSAEIINKYLSHSFVYVCRAIYRRWPDYIIRNVKCPAHALSYTFPCELHCSIKVDWLCLVILFCRIRFKIAINHA